MSRPYLCPFCGWEIPAGAEHRWQVCAMRVDDQRHSIRDRMAQMQADRDEALAILREIEAEEYVVKGSTAERLDALVRRFEEEDQPR